MLKENISTDKLHQLFDEADEILSYGLRIQFIKLFNLFQKHKYVYLVHITPEILEL